MDDWANRRVWLAQIFHVDIDTGGWNAVRDGDHQVALVLRNLRIDEFHGAEILAREAFAEDEFVAGGRRSELVIEDQHARGVELDTGIARGGQGVGQFVGFRDVGLVDNQNVDGLFIGAAGTNSIDQQRAVFRDVVDLD